MSVINIMGLLVEEDLDDIGMNSIKAVIHLECDGKSSWTRSLGELRPTQSEDQWVDWITNPPSGEEVPNIDWLIAVFPSTKKNDGRPDPRIKSWGQPVKEREDILMEIFNLKSSLVFL